MNEREIQYFDTQANQGGLKKAVNKEEDSAPAREDNSPEWNEQCAQKPGMTLT